MSNYNLVQQNWVKAQGSFMTSSGNPTTSQAVLHALIVGTYTPGATFRAANGTATNKTYMTGTFTPNGLGIQPIVLFKELEFSNGIYIEMTGTINLTAVYNDLI